MPLIDPLDELAPQQPTQSSAQEGDGPKPLVDPLDMMRGKAEGWANKKPPMTEEERNFNPLDDFWSNAGVGAVESVKELGTGANLWGQRAFSALGTGVARDTLQQNLEAESNRRAMYDPIRGTWGYIAGSAAPVVAASALVPPSGQASYAANAAFSALPELDPAGAIRNVALSVPATAVANRIGAAAAKGSNTVLGRVDPIKEEAVAADRLLRSQDGLGLPYTSLKTTPARTADFNTTIAQNHPVAALDRIKAAADVENAKLWGSVDQIAQANGATIKIDPTNTLTALSSFRKDFGTSPLTDLANPKDSAALLYMMGNERAARNTLNRTLSDADRANPAVANQFFQDIQQGMTGASFEQMRALQQRIGNAIGDLSAKPDADRKVLAGLRKAYSSVLDDMEKTGNTVVDKQLTDALKAASKQHREEVMPFRTGEVNGAVNPILRNYANGVYTNDPSQILADLSTTRARSGFSNFVTPRLTPEEAASVQKIISEPSLVRDVRKGAENAPSSSPSILTHPVKWAENRDFIRYSPILKRALAADPALLENTAARGVTRGGMGGLRILMDAAAPGLIDKTSGVVSDVLSPLTRWFNGDNHNSGAAYVPYAGQQNNP